MTAQMAEAVAAWRGEAPEVSVRRILKVHGYRDLATVRRPILRAAESAVSVARETARPEAAWRRLRIAMVDESELRLAGGARFTGATFGRVLSRCPEVAVFVLTLGPDYDEAISARTGDDPVTAFFLETAGWLSVELATRGLARDLDAALAPGLRTATRLGPGYNYRGPDGRQNWPLEEQRELFSLLEPGPLPVTLLESCAMIPKMSRSGLFGLIRAEDAHMIDDTEGAPET